MKSRSISARRLRRHTTRRQHLRALAKAKKRQRVQALEECEDDVCNSPNSSSEQDGADSERVDASLERESHDSMSDASEENHGATNVADRFLATRLTCPFSGTPVSFHMAFHSTIFGTFMAEGKSFAAAYRLYVEALRRCHMQPLTQPTMIKRHKYFTSTPSPGQRYDGRSGNYPSDLTAELKDRLHEWCEEHLVYRKPRAPRATLDDCRAWLESSEAVVVSVSTVSRWMKKLGFSFTHIGCTHSAYLDRHEEPDVVAHRKRVVQLLRTQWHRRVVKGANLDAIDRLLRRGPPYSPQEQVTLGVELVHVMEPVLVVYEHDETTLMLNESAKGHWFHVAIGSRKLPDRVGQRIVVSAFLTIVPLQQGSQCAIADAWLHTDQARGFQATDLHAHVQRLLRKHTEAFPAAMPVILFDNSSCHGKLPQDGLDVSKFVLAGFAVRKGTLVRCRDTSFRCPDTGQMRRQSLMISRPVADDEQGSSSSVSTALEWGTKPLRQVLQERGEAGLEACSAAELRERLAQWPDFKTQPTALEEIVAAAGGRAIMLPKFHCELNSIEMAWHYSKRLVREAQPKNVEEACTCLRRVLHGITVHQARRWRRHTARYWRAYADGLTGPAALSRVQAESRVRKRHEYRMRKSHRTSTQDAAVVHGGEGDDEETGVLASEL